MDSRRQFEEQGVAERRVWKVGELARRAGVSVRGLHHYEEIGLLVPSRRTAAGHRRYEDGDVLRLQQIASLRSLGFSLGEIRNCLDASGYAPARVIELHIARLRERIELEKRLCDRLEAVANRLAATEDSAGDVSAGEFVETVMEVTKMSERIEKYYTPEQREQLERRRQEVGEERIREVEAEWPELMEQVRAAMEAGTDTADERAQALARRWMGLVEEFTGGDAGIARSVGNMWRQEETIHNIDTAPMREMMAYISRANASSDRRE